MSGTIRIGTSGWNYDSFRLRLYPEGLERTDWLAHYAQRLPAVEINRTFYSLPDVDAVRRWRKQTPDDFVFAVKASRYITHMKKLNEPREALDRLLDCARLLGGKLGPILFQLPPNWKFNAERLERFLKMLPTDLRYAFELRDPGWLNPEAYRLLSQKRAALVIDDFKGRSSPREVTADFVYVRLHGPGSEPYVGSYGEKTLQGWAGAFSTWSDQGRDVYCFFDNTKGGDAIDNAMALHHMVSQ